MQRAVGADREARAVWCDGVSQAKALLCSLSVELGRWSQGGGDRGKVWSQILGVSKSTKTCFAWILVAWSFVGCLVLPMMLVLLHPPAWEGLIRRTPWPLLGLVLRRPREVLHLVRIAAQRSGAQRSVEQGWSAGGGRLLLAGPAGWRRENAEDVSVLQTRLACASCDLVLVKAGSEGRIESGRIEEGCRAGFEGAKAVSRMRVEGQKPGGDCCKGSLCFAGRSPRGQQRLVLEASR